MKCETSVEPGKTFMLQSQQFRMRHRNQGDEVRKITTVQSLQSGAHAAQPELDVPLIARPDAWRIRFAWISGLWPGRGRYTSIDASGRAADTAGIRLFEILRLDLM
jgi:hypothetical protein